MSNRIMHPITKGSTSMSVLHLLTDRNWLARSVIHCCLYKDFPARLQTSWKEELMQEMAVKASSRYHLLDLRRK